MSEQFKDGTANAPDRADSANRRGCAGSTISAYFALATGNHNQCRMSECAITAGRVHFRSN